MTTTSLKRSLVAGIAASLTFTSPAPAVANDLGKALVGAAIICGLTNCVNGRPRSNGTARAAPRGNPAVKADQQALNYFGYNVGTADGVTGAKTRNGVSQYQAYMGYPVTGVLDEYQRTNLQGAHAWANSGRAAAYPGVVGPELLRAYASEARGGNYCVETGRCPAPNQGYPNQAYPNQTYPNNNGVYGNTGFDNHANGIYETSTNVAPATMPQPQVVAPAASPSLPSFGDVAQQTASRSMTGHCQNVGFLTAANGGMITDPTQVDNPAHALDEQFCGARDSAIAAGEQKISGANISDAQLAEACGQVVSLMRPQLDALDTQSPEQVTLAAGQMAASAGWNQGMMMQTGEICLGYGYRTDDADTVLAANMLLVGAGTKPYAEIFGHHKRLGMGTTANSDIAAAWYGEGLSALEGGANPVFLPAQSAQRVAVMRSALGGASSVAASAGAGTAPALPGFNLGD